jgi:ABC-type transport system substrate-binding protein
MNVAIPPFDDVHVRRAANLAIDRSALLRTDPLSSGRPATHIIPDALENGLLDGYDPYPARNGSPDIRRARAEMAKSRYDRDRDGVCDSRVCDSLLAATRVEPIYRRQAAIVAEGLKRLGIHLHWRAFDVEGFFEKTTLQRGKYAVALPITWLADYPSASGVLNPLFFGPEFQTLGNPSLVGAPDRVLREAGYRRRRTPDIDSTISLCNREIGAEAFSCWAQADMLLMQRVVPWVPYNFPRNIELVGPRVRRFSWDQSSGGPLPAFERIVLR